ncbi:hypothetical protein NVP1193O_109 [Vibrio phage 1.193.O._10N.286.52.C6]|nr:hypothetical protein NVP1193O_109 [Vibrio phage 1.193.O._10N.286.52.C6]
MQCVCGNWVHSSFGKQSFSIELCSDCLKAGNSPSYWNSKEYEHSDTTDNGNLYNKEHNDN